jgi:hypothetical protein
MRGGMMDATVEGPGTSTSAGVTHVSSKPKPGLRLMLTDLVPPLRAFAVALGGVALASIWYEGEWWADLLAALGVLGVFMLGLALDKRGVRLAARDPVRAVELMEWWMLAPMALAAAASALVIVVTVTFAVPEGATPAEEEMLTALSGGITTFLTAAFIDIKYERDGSTLALRIGYELTNVCRSLRVAAEDCECWKERGERQGWSRTARRRRAVELEKILSGGHLGRLA